jgi:CrcB protein
LTDDQDRPVDPDVDLTMPAQRREVRPREWDLIAVIAVGGVLGAEARYGLSRAITHPAGALPWSTVTVNLVGSFLLGLLIAGIDARGAHRLLRPFVGVGILGGFTTFSTFAVDIDSLLHAHRIGVAIGYLAVTLVGCLVAVTAAYRFGRRALGAAS